MLPPSGQIIFYCRFRAPCSSRCCCFFDCWLRPSLAKAPTLSKASFTDNDSAGHRQTRCLWTTFLLQWSLNMWPRSLGCWRRWGRRRSRCLKWQTAGRRWHALLAKYSTPRSNSADRENIDSVIQGPPAPEWDVEGKTPSVCRHRHACVQWSRVSSAAIVENHINADLGIFFILFIVSVHWCAHDGRACETS